MPHISELRVGVVGLGSQSLKEHVPAILESDNTVLVSVYDSDETKYEEVKKLYEGSSGDGVTYCSNMDDVFVGSDLDFVLASVPHDIYQDVITLCCENKVHLLKEKPFSRNFEEGKKFTKNIHDAKIYVMTAYQRRFHPLYSSFKMTLGSIGKISHIQCNYLISSSNPNSGWRGQKRICGGGVLLDMGYHLIDMLIWFLEGKPEWVRMRSSVRDLGRYDVEDTCSVDFEIGGASGNMLISCIAPESHESIIVFGSNGSAILGREYLIRKNLRGNVVDRLEAPKHWSSANINQLDYFCDVVRGKSSPYYSTPEFQMDHHVPIIDACYRSEEENRVVFLNEYETVG